MHNTRTRTRNPNFLVKPDPNPTRSQKALLVKAWSSPHILLAKKDNANLQTQKSFIKKAPNPKSFDKTLTRYILCTFYIQVPAVTTC